MVTGFVRKRRHHLPDIVHGDHLPKNELPSCIRIAPPVLVDRLYRDLNFYVLRVQGAARMCVGRTQA